MAEKLFYSMGEVSELFDVNQSLIRHWEKQFDVLRPKRNKKGNRLFSPQDVEYLKLIYHLVKERGMTLEGARKALRRHRPDSGVPRDAELMERLQRIRSLLVEVREQLKESPSDEVYSDSDADREPAAAEISATPSVPAASAETVAAEVVVKEEVAAEAVAAEAAAVEDIATEAVADEPLVDLASAEEPEEPADDLALAAEMGTPVAEPALAKEPADIPAEPEPEAEPEPKLAPESAPEPPLRAGSGKKPRRKKDDDDNHELFAYYEQSLF